MARKGREAINSRGTGDVIRVADPDAATSAGIHPDDRVAYLLDDLRVETARLADAREREAEAVEHLAEAVDRLADVEAELDGDDAEVRRGRTGDGVVRVGGTSRSTTRVTARPSVVTANEAEGA